MTQIYLNKIVPIRSSEEITETAMQIIKKYWKFEKYVRAVRVRVSNLEKIDKVEQLSQIYLNKIVMKC